jgi:hypothetical protein
VAETAYGALEIAAGDTFAVLGGTAPVSLSGRLELLVTVPSYL